MNAWGGFILYVDLSSTFVEIRTSFESMGSLLQARCVNAFYILNIYIVGLL